jgi:hypothetical protein
MFVDMVFPTQKTPLMIPNVAKEINKFRVPIVGEEKFLSDFGV